MSGGGERSPACVETISKLRTNSSNNQKTGIAVQPPSTTINLNINTKVNNISINPITIKGNNNSVIAPQV
jgi:hypothetical protein